MPTCFVAMPISTRAAEAEAYGDEDHWLHVMESLFVKAIETAGFRVIRPVAQGSHLIHGLIIRHLSEADLVLCDLSSHNPNVFFELGVRTSLNRPIALVRDERTELPFDTSGINTHQYKASLRGWEIGAEQERLASHITQSVASCGGANPLWRQFGLSIRAQEPDTHESPLEAKVDLLANRIQMLQQHAQEDRMERNQTLMTQEEMMVASRHGSWRGLQFGDLTHVAPSELFVSEAYHDISHTEINIHPLGPRSVVIHARRPIGPEDRQRLEILAARYEVEISFELPKSQNSRTAKTQRQSPPGETRGDRSMRA